jgi:sigma-E factor negative regulatory protein RseC
MATERGTVVKIDAQGTWVKTTQSSACAGCSARGSCHTKPGSGDREVNAINTVGAVVGDRILLGIETAPLLKATFLLYVFPILALLIGAFVGHALAINLQRDATNSAVFAGILFFVASVLIMRRRANRMALQDAYRPKIIRIL